MIHSFHDRTRSGYSRSSWLATLGHRPRYSHPSSVRSMRGVPQSGCSHRPIPSRRLPCASPSSFCCHHSLRQCFSLRSLSCVVGFAFLRLFRFSSQRLYYVSCTQSLGCPGASLSHRYSLSVHFPTFIGVLLLADWRLALPFLSTSYITSFRPSESFLMQSATPNHALQRTGAAVTPAASATAFPPTTQRSRQPRRSLSLRSLGVSSRLV